MVPLWSDADQGWKVTWPNGVVLGVYPTRPEALAAESAELNRLIDAGEVESVFA